MLKALSSFFGWCSNRAMIEHAPTSGLRRSRGLSRDRVLDDSELCAVWRAAETAGPAGALARLLILSGCRRNEIAHLEWSEVGSEVITLPKERTKTNVEHRIAITPAMRAVLDALPRHPGRRFAINDSNKLMHVSGRHKLDVDIGDWRLHDLRRSFASGCARIGILPHVIERMLNHKLGGVAAIYNRHAYEAEMKDGWEKWSKHVSQIVETTC
jgi:integrase